MQTRKPKFVGAGAALMELMSSARAGVLRLVCSFLHTKLVVVLTVFAAFNVQPARAQPTPAQEKERLEEMQRDADTLLEIVQAQSDFLLKALGADLSRATPVEQLAIKQHALAISLCGMRTIEIWPDKYRRAYYQAFRGNKDVLTAQRALESMLQADLAAGVLSKAVFAAWGTRVEGIARSCERQKTPPLLDEIAKKLKN